MNIFAAQSVGKFTSQAATSFTSTTSKIASAHKLALCYHAQKNYDQAERMYKEALASLDTPVGRKEAEYGQVLNNLARLYHCQGKFDAAEPLYRKSLDAVQQHYGEFHPKVARRLTNLAELFRAMGRNVESIIHFQRAAAIMERNAGLEDPTTVRTLKSYAAMLRKVNRITDAEEVEARIPLSASTPPMDSAVLANR
jgi:tetratricopeptide (TPR) repeat protein